MDRPLPSSNNGKAAYLRVRAFSTRVHAYRYNEHACLVEGWHAAV
jgi:hypothetical protein